MKDKPSKEDILIDFTVWQDDVPDAIFQNSIFVAGISPVGTYTLFRQDFFKKAWTHRSCDADTASG